jgi:hypothetical protein
MRWADASIEEGTGMTLRRVGLGLLPGAKYRLAVPLLQRTEQTFSAMILGCGD